MKQALIVWGGWDGHEPELIARFFGEILEKEDFKVEISGTMDSLNDVEKLKCLDLIIPVVTMDKISKQQTEAVSEAVAAGTGIAGCHGGMCDAFRESVLWQFITGGNWVSHPGGDGVEYTVNIIQGSSPIVEGLKDFNVKSEHYYLHVDPAVKVLATTRFPSVKWYHSSNGPVDMPVVWTKMWGHGRVFYSSLGHHCDIAQMETPAEIFRRGFLWAAEGKAIVVEKGLTTDEFKSELQMF
jgi:type 1 glutamine amidotransferase